ncbi:LysR substrate-binding domain-containing protein [Roseomonas mucosa]|uniref:LysR substrate-binding domain-containing protein n=1 Tax=Roseomonas mucosa TaxID=207340 RepID=UPI0025B76F69|nr:LysR substrate-binding domain-containing protein [Roseomonas mucosa]
MGSRLDADHPSNRVPIPCRSTTALGLVAAESGICLVPASVETLRRDNVAYRPIKEKAVSPVIMSTRKGDRSPEIALLLQLVKDIYRREGIAFGV